MGETPIYAFNSVHAQTFSSPFSYQQLSIIKEGEATELKFFNMLIEDRNMSAMSLAEFDAFIRQWENILMRLDCLIRQWALLVISRPTSVETFKRQHIEFTPTNDSQSASSRRFGSIDKPIQWSPGSFSFVLPTSFRLSF